ncbi:MAG: DMT family transporter [Burkholderiales bacterium]|nr:DMT family transporter [Burkholderiales bacterium]
MTWADFARLSALACCWGFAFVFIRVAVSEFGAVALVEVRTLIACVLLLWVAQVRGIALDWRGRWKSYLAIASINSALPFTLIAFAQTALTASFTVIAVAVTPLLSALVAALWIGESLSARKLAGLALGIAGVALLIGWAPGGDATPLWAELLLLAASLSYAVAGVATKRYFQHLPPHALATGSQLGTALWLLVPAFFYLPAQVPGALAWSAAAAAGVFSSAIAFMLYFRLIADIGPVKTLSVNYLTPLAGVTGGVLLLGETVTANMAAGALLIMAGVALVLRAPQRRAP